jgi:DNA-binding NarL/FixJ family response regulator
MDTIVIVDDHRSFRAQARAMLAAEGFDIVAEAGDGVGAIDVIRESAPDVVLLDVELPDLDGFAVLERLAASGLERRRVVLTSSRDRSAYAHRLAACGAAGFVAKEELTGDAVRALIAGAAR